MMVISTFLPMALICVSSVFSFHSNDTVDDIVQRWRVKFETEYPECLTQSNITEAELEAFWEKLQYSDTRGFKCYLECMYRSYKLYSEGGSFNRDAIVQTFDKITYEAFDVCYGEKMKKEWPERCEMVFHFDFCLFRYNDTYGVSLI